MSGAEGQDDKLPINQADGDHPKNSETKADKPQENDTRSAMELNNQFIPQSRYTFPEPDSGDELAGGSAPGLIEPRPHVQDMVRGQDGLMYPKVPWKSLKDMIRQEELKKKEQEQNATAACAIVEYSSPSPDRGDSSPEDECQFYMEMDEEDKKS